MSFDNKNYEVFESDGQTSEKLDYTLVLMKQMRDCGYFMSRMNECPSYVYGAITAGVNIDLENVKPNRLNFVNSVETLRIMLEPYVDKTFKEAMNKYRVEKSIENKDEFAEVTQNDIKISRYMFQQLMSLMARKSLLPIESIF